MNFLKVWEWPQQLASAALGVLLLVAAGWYVDHRLEKHYTAKGQAEVEEQTREAKVTQSKANTAAIATFKAKQATAIKQLDYRLNEVQTYAKKLPAVPACPADAEFMRLYNDGRSR